MEPPTLMPGVSLSAIIVGATAGLLGVLSVWLYRRSAQMNLFRRYGIPGPRPNLLTGNLLQLRQRQIPDDVIAEWIKEYGNVFGYYIADQPYLLIKNLEAIKAIMIREFHNFCDRPPMSLDSKPLCYSVVFLRGQRWKEVRRVMTPAFSGSKIKQMSVIFNQAVDVFLEELDRAALGGDPFDIYVKIQSLTLDVIARCALCMKIDCQRNPNDSFLMAVREFFATCNNPAVMLGALFPPFAAVLSFINNHLTAGQMTNMVVKNLRQVIGDRRKQSDQKRLDMLQLMLDASVEGNASGTKIQLTDNEVVGNAYIFLLAGFDTTSSALGFTCYLLAKHPEIQEKIHDEVCARFPDGKEYLTHDDVQELQYLDQVLSESLRLYPPVTGFITRHCEQDCTIEGIFIPEGTSVFIPVLHIHRDPELWPDPEKFDPERFSLENKVRIRSGAYLPFGMGQRNCIGMRFALLEAKVALARMIRKFKLVTCEKTEDPLQLSCPTVIIGPANGIYVKAIPRH